MGRSHISAEQIQLPFKGAPIASLAIRFRTFAACSLGPNSKLGIPRVKHDAVQVSWFRISPTILLVLEE